MKSEDDQYVLFLALAKFFDQVPLFLTLMFLMLFLLLFLLPCLPACLPASLSLYSTAVPRIQSNFSRLSNSAPVSVKWPWRPSRFCARESLNAIGPRASIITRIARNLCKLITISSARKITDSCIPIGKIRRSSTVGGKVNCTCTYLLVWLVLLKPSQAWLFVLSGLWTNHHGAPSCLERFR